MFLIDILKILKETCGDDEMIFEIARSLLEVERKHFKSNRRTGLFDEFENIFKNHFIKIELMQLNMLKTEKEN